MYVSYYIIDTFKLGLIKKMALETKDIVSLVVAALLIGILLPIGLTALITSGSTDIIYPFNHTGNNESAVYFSNLAPVSIMTLITIVIPIVVVIVIMMRFLKR